MIGSHLSTAGGMVNALCAAKTLRMQCVQVFTKNQRQWRSSPLPSSQVQEWLATLQQMNWDHLTCDTSPRVVSHNMYLINLASPDDDLWKKSLAAQRDELERCEQLHIAYCVSHPGAHLLRPRQPGSRNDLTSPPSRDERRGLKRIASALNAMHRDLPGYRVLTCLETTVGSGTNLGYSFQQLAMIRDLVRQPERIGFCFDTCHVTAAGYSMRTAAAAQAVLQQWDAICGWQNLRVFHLNDSAGDCGSRRDRHAHIGEGCCGRDCFRTILNHPAFQAVPKILETPKGVNQQNVNWDLVNVRRLKRMTKRPVHADNEANQPVLT